MFFEFVLPGGYFSLQMCQLIDLVGDYVGPFVGVPILFEVKTEYLGALLYRDVA